MNQELETTETRPPSPVQSQVIQPDGFGITGARLEA